MKGIILAGGDGTRLKPITISFSKQLLPVFDKPLIYYPLATLMNLGIKEILIIIKNNQKNNFQNLLGNGSQFGINIKYAIQNEPNGIAEALIIGKKFLKNDPVALILGDNIFYSQELNNKNKIINNNGATVFLYRVKNPYQYGVAKFHNNKLQSIVEKPSKPPSNLAVTGLYIYDNKAIELVNDLKPSKRNELEITDLNNLYIKKQKMKYVILEDSSVWFDAGTPSSLLFASQYIQAIQERNNILILSPEEVALRKKYITKKSLINNLKDMPKNNYFDKLTNLKT